MIKKSTTSQAIMKLDTRAKGKFKENVQEFVDNFGSSVPPGPYNCQLSQAMLYANKNSDPQVDFIFIVLEGEHEGQQIRDMNTIAEKGKRTVELALRIVSGRLQHMGCVTADISNGVTLNKKLEELTKHKPKVSLTVDDGQYRNISNITMLQDSSEGDGGGESSDESQDGSGGESGGNDSWEVGQRVTVNDPNDDDSPWNGEIVNVTSDTDVEVKQDTTGDDWIVQTQFLTAEA